MFQEKNYFENHFKNHFQEKNIIMRKSLLLTVSPFQLQINMLTANYEYSRSKSGTMVFVAQWCSGYHYCTISFN